jgi:hypothetical protein
LSGTKDLSLSVCHTIKSHSARSLPNDLRSFESYEADEIVSDTLTHLLK